MSNKTNGDHPTTDRLSEHAHESVDKTAGTAAKAEERHRHETEDAQARVSDMGQKGKRRSEEALHSVSHFVEENPLTSLGIAFAAGALLSSLRRRS